MRSSVCLFAVALLVLAASARAAPATKLGAGKWFDRVLFMLFENHSEQEVIADPNFSKYTNLGRGLENYYAVTHPSQPNYISLTAGDYFGIQSDSDVNLPQTHIADLVEGAGLTWKAYMEDYTNNCDASKSIGKYYRKHNPFISYNNVRTNATRCANIQDLVAFDADLQGDTLPNYMFLSPNIDNDGHNTNVATAGQWLDSFLSARLLKLPARTLVVVTWDEDDYSEANKVLTFLLDPHASIFAPSSVDDTLYSHFSALRTVEDNWALGTLGRQDASAYAFNFSAGRARA